MPNVFSRLSGAFFGSLGGAISGTLRGAAFGFLGSVESVGRLMKDGGMGSFLFGLAISIPVIVIGTLGGGGVGASAGFVEGGERGYKKGFWKVPSDVVDILTEPKGLQSGLKTLNKGLGLVVGGGFGAVAGGLRGVVQGINWPFEKMAEKTKNSNGAVKALGAFLACLAFPFTCALWAVKETLLGGVQGARNGAKSGIWRQEDPNGKLNIGQSAVAILMDFTTEGARATQSQSAWNWVKQKLGISSNATPEQPRPRPGSAALAPEVEDQNALTDDEGEQLLPPGSGPRRPSSSTRSSLAGLGLDSSAGLRAPSSDVLADAKRAVRSSERPARLSESKPDLPDGDTASETASVTADSSGIHRPDTSWKKSFLLDDAEFKKEKFPANWDWEEKKRVLRASGVTTVESVRISNAKSNEAKADPANKIEYTVTKDRIFTKQENPKSLEAMLDRFVATYKIADGIIPKIKVKNDDIEQKFRDLIRDHPEKYAGLKPTFERLDAPDLKHSGMRLGT